MIGGKIKQIVNCRIGLDKSRNTEIDILINQSEIEYDVAVKRSVLKSTTTWAQRNAGRIFVYGLYGGFFGALYYFGDWE